jgi:Tfp pilus assembly protein PilV
MMILLTVIAVGMLSLSAISLRSVRGSSAAAEARSNAQLALQLAIAELQRHAGPDTRVTTLLGQDASLAPEKKHWTAVYRSWPQEAAARPAPERLAVLASNPSPAQDVSTASLSETNSVALVGTGTLGTSAPSDAQVRSLLVGLQDGTKLNGRYAWWVGDQGVKAAVAAGGSEPASSVIAARATMQAAPSNAPGMAMSGMDTRPFEALKPFDPSLSKVTSWRQADFLALPSGTQAPLFHDLAHANRALITNVRAGGFRKDMSILLDRSTPPAGAENFPLYRVGGRNGIHLAELWQFQNLPYALHANARSSTYTTGGSFPSNAPHFQFPTTQAEVLADTSFIYKQPAIVSYRVILSLKTRPVSGQPGVHRLGIVVDPVVTCWNPLDVPIVMTPAYNSVKFWQLPYDLDITVDSTRYTVSLRELLGRNTSGHYLTLIIGNQTPVVMKPGEVIMFSQGPNTSVEYFNSTSTLRYINARPGWNFGGGVAMDLQPAAGQYIDSGANPTVRYEVTPNRRVSEGTRHWSLTHHEVYWKEDRTGRGDSVSLGGLFIDYIGGAPTERLYAANHPEFFGQISRRDGRTLTFNELSEKQPIMTFAINAKTEMDAKNRTRHLAKFNPKAWSIDFQSLTADELALLPFEVEMRPVNGIFDLRLDLSPTGQAYFGGGYRASDGVSTLITHAVPRQPVHSLAAFQNAFANGFSDLRLNDSYAVTNLVDQLMPYAHHAIGNSLASSSIPADRTQFQLSGNRPLADHSYLANEALWDEWFLSGVSSFNERRGTVTRNMETARQVVEDFFTSGKRLPNSRFIPAFTGQGKATDRIFAGSNYHAEAHRRIGGMIMIDGAFNVNSTSVEAWKTVLGALRGQSIAARDANGVEQIQSNESATPVINGAPVGRTVAENFSVINHADQYQGRRVLSDPEIDELARAIVREVKARGPFLSLADFVNRRVGTDARLAKAGAIQSALDATDVSINRDYNTARAVRVAPPGTQFPDVELGPAAFGIPGIVKQADILTPIGPYLTVRSDTFVIRAYGEAMASDGRTVLARAWCEAMVERAPDYVDPADNELAEPRALAPANREFGRRFKMTSFRWLNAAEV